MAANFAANYQANLRDRTLGQASLTPLANVGFEAAPINDAQLTVDPHIEQREIARSDVWLQENRIAP